MENIFKEIVKKVEESSTKQDSFTLPTFDDCEITESGYSSGGATLFGKQYEIKKGNKRIIVTYECKDKCRTFQINPDLNIVTINHFDGDGKLISNFSESWEDKY